jgi:hypothetical protein
MDHHDLDGEGTFPLTLTLQNGRVLLESVWEGPLTIVAPARGAGG